MHHPAMLASLILFVGMLLIYTYQVIKHRKP